MRHRKNVPEGEAWCSYHQCSHPLEAFNKDVSRWNGKQAYCRRALAPYFRQYRQTLKELERGKHR